MWKFTIRRMLIVIPQIILLSVLVFVLAKMMPGDALSGQVDPNVSHESLENIREKLGWNDPWYQQYGRWIGDLAQGDLGQSFSYKMPVTELISQRSEEHTSELQSRFDLVCRLLLEKKKTKDK